MPKIEKAAEPNKVRKFLKVAEQKRELISIIKKYNISNDLKTHLIEIVKGHPDPVDSIEKTRSLSHKISKSKFVQFLYYESRLLLGRHSCVLQEFKKII